MLRDITIGQHFPGTSPVHRMDPRVKLLLTIVFMVTLLLCDNPVGLGVTIVFLMFAYGLAKIPGRLVWRSLKPLLPILAFTFLLNLLFLRGSGEPLFSWWIITISKEGLYNAFAMAIRIVCLIAGMSLLTYTTSPIVLTDAIERLLSPLGRLGFPAHELAMMMTIALRMIPTLIEETDKIMSAQKARGAELDSGSLLHRVKALVPILIPLFLSAFRRADDLAMAMESRCYHGGEGRTRLRQLRVTRADIIGGVLCCALFVFVGLSDRLFTALFMGLGSF